MSHTEARVLGALVAADRPMLRHEIEAALTLLAGNGDSFDIRKPLSRLVEEGYITYVSGGMYLGRKPPARTET